MKYQSTRGQIKNIPFKQAVMMGLAEDGGLLLPESIPQLTPGDLDALAKLAYPELAFQVMSYFIEDIPENELRSIINRTFDFSIPLVEVSDNVFSLELFHGPTLAFKDIGARFLAGCLNFIAKGFDKKLKVLVATSGDTGSAVAHGFYGKWFL